MSRFSADFITVLKRIYPPARLVAAQLKGAEIPARNIHNCSTVVYSCSTVQAAHFRGTPIKVSIPGLSLLHTLVEKIAYNLITGGIFAGANHRGEGGK